MKVGDTVEYFADGESTGVIGVITGFDGDRARVLCPSVHEWLLRKTNLAHVSEARPSPVSPERIHKQ